MLAYHNIDLIYTPAADSWCYEMRHLTVSQVDMSVERRRQLDLSQIRELHCLTDFLVTVKVLCCGR